MMDNGNSCQALTFVFNFAGYFFARLGEKVTCENRKVPTFTNALHIPIESHQPPW
jgi:hypothetical protein